MYDWLSGYNLGSKKIDNKIELMTKKRYTICEFIVSKFIFFLKFKSFTFGSKPLVNLL